MNNEYKVNINEEKSVEYIGIYEALDEILDRMKNSKPLGDFERYCHLFIELYKILEKVDENE